VQAPTITRERGTRPGPRFTEAVAYALDVHSTQRRAGTTQPYAAHLLRVAGLVLEDGGSEPEAIAALLHDAVEDQGGAPRLADIRRRFGSEVAALVDELTDTCEDPPPPWRPRKERYLVHLADSSPGALRVSLADKLANVRSLIRDYRVQGEDLWENSGKAKGDVLWYYRTLASRFAELRPGPLAEELMGAVGEFERLVGGRLPQVISGAV
jgi:(p)ppGpp synthase/HD superfamily hydrolase